MSRLDNELHALGALTPPELQERWRSLEKSNAPALPNALLRRLLAQGIQERRFGSLPVMVTRELARALDKDVVVTSRAPCPTLSHGTRVIREWNGKTVVVEVLEHGFLWEGRTYRSLSVIARAVTGAHWSGPRFFGLRTRG